MPESAIAPRTAWRLLAVLAILCLALAIAHIWIGASDPSHPWTLRMSITDVISELLRGKLADPTGPNLLVWEIRLPRVLACLLVGGILGFVGSAFQALFRNPLADPYIVGTSSGAAVGGVVSIWLGWASWAGGLGLMLCAFASAVGALLLVLAMSVNHGWIDTGRLLLAGVVVGGFLASLVAGVLLAAGQDANQVLRWLLGSTTPMFWSRLPPLALVWLVGGAVLFWQSRRLNAFALGEATAKRLGVNTARLKLAILGIGTAMVAVAVGTVGIIGFLGLIAPHIARRVVGVDWRFSLLGSGLIGSSLLIVSDVLAQWTIAGAEVPVGVVTALLGSPVLLLLLRREAAVGDLV